MKRLFVFFLALSLLFAGCSSQEPTVEDAQIHEGTQIKLSDDQITVDGKQITNDSTQAVYAARDIVFYLAGQDFTYGEGETKDEHTQEQADAHTVVHITKPGRYILTGQLSLGQIAVDLGEDAQTNPEAVVTLILNDVDITCRVAPAVIFYNVYECCSNDEETATKDVDTKNAGANVIIADGTENNINGAYVAKIYKTYQLSDDGTQVIDSKKLHKYDGAFYSRQTLNIDGGEKGSGVLNIYAENEGLDSELHLTINGGTINITSGNDGINTNEDNVSVTTVNDGTVNILCNGTTGEGDGIDSNGWLVINGGHVNAQACATSGDAGIDSDKGIYINGGNVIASGNMLDRIAGGNQTYAVFQFANRQNGGSTYTLKNSEGKTIRQYTPTNAFTYLIIAGAELTPGDHTLWQDQIQLSGMQGGMPQGERPQMPNFQPDQMPEPPEGMETPEKPNGDRQNFPDGERPEMPDGQRPQRPENMTPPANPGNMKEENRIPNAETSTTFSLVKGANQFANVGPAAE